MVDSVYNTTHIDLLSEQVMNERTGSEQADSPEQLCFCHHRMTQVAINPAWCLHQLLTPLQYFRLIRTAL